MLLWHICKTRFIPAALGFAAVLTVAAGPVATQSQREPELAAVLTGQATPQMPPGNKQYRQAFKDIQAGMSERQRQVGRLFEHYGFEGAGLLLGRSVSANLHESPATSPLRPAFSAAFAQSYCAADAVAVGRVLEGRSFPIESATFLFTEYRVGVNEVFKQLKNTPLLTGRSFELYRAGGVVTLFGNQLSATRNDLPPLEAGSDYIFFLTFDAASGALISTEANDLYRLASGSGKALKPRGLSDADESVGIPLQRFRQAAGAQRCR